MQNKKVSTGFAISIIVILSAVLGGAFWMMGENSAQNVMSTNVVPAQKYETKAVDSSQKVAQISESQGVKVIYKNDKLGFSLDLPENWKEYKTKTAASRVDDAYHRGVIYITLLSKDAAWPDEMADDGSRGKYAPMIAVEYMPLSDWNVLFSKCESDRMKEINRMLDAGKSVTMSAEEDSLSHDCGSIDTFVGKNDRYAFVVQPGQDMPDDLRPLWPQEWNGLGYVDFFKKGFKML